MWIVSHVRMVKMTLAKINFIILGFISCVNLFAAENVKKLHYNFNPNVTIWITNQPCTDVKFRRTYPWAAEAVRSDGEVLQGCFNGEQNTVTIQWLGGDTSKFPADYFLGNKDN